MINCDYYYQVRPFWGEKVSGDDVYVMQDSHELFFSIVDVTGHGEEAGALAKKIREFIKRNRKVSFDTQFKKLHETLKLSRGAAIGLGRIDMQTSKCEFCSVGNIMGIHFSDKDSKMVSKEGIVGIRRRNLFINKIELKTKDKLLFFSDGVQGKINRETYPIINSGTSEVVATGIMKQFSKSNDDSSCLVIDICDPEPK